MSIDDRLIFLGTIKELNKQEAHSGKTYVVAGEKLNCEFYGRLEHALKQFKTILSNHGYVGAVEFSLKPALNGRDGYAITAAPIMRNG